MQSTKLKVADVELELLDTGQGAARPVLFLHGGGGFSPQQPFVAPLSEKRRFVAPTHPGFGKSTLPDWLDSIDDIAHLYLPGHRLQVGVKLGEPFVEPDRRIDSGMLQQQVHVFVYGDREALGGSSLHDDRIQILRSQIECRRDFIRRIRLVLLVRMEGDDPHRRFREREQQRYGLERRQRPVGPRVAPLIRVARSPERA